MRRKGLASAPERPGAQWLISSLDGPRLVTLLRRLHITASPVPVVVHILCAVAYAILGAFQFSGALRRRWPGWHRVAGRVLVVLGLGVAFSALWMTQFYPRAPGGELAYAFRLAFGSGMAALALAGLTGMYLRQVTKIGLLGLLGYVLFSAGYLLMLGTEFVAAFILPTLAHTAPAYVNDVIAAANNGTAIGGIGLMQTVILVTGIAYLAGGFIFGIALFRANVLARWAAALLAVGTLATIATGIMPQYERLFAIPTGVALIGLGYSLWRQQRTPAARPLPSPVSSQLEPAGAQ